MAETNRETLKGSITINLPNNTTGEITAGDIRDALHDIADSVPFKYTSQGIPPVANDDINGTASHGSFAIGDQWVDVASDIIYICADNTANAAIWQILATNFPVIGDGAAAINQVAIWQNDSLIEGSADFTFAAGVLNVLGTITTSADATINALTIGNGGNNDASNTAIGQASLIANTLGSNNAATGSRTLTANTEGTNNVATGTHALTANTIGNSNTATGAYTLSANTTGINNTATGNDALFFNTTGSKNVATGKDALYSNTTGNNNIATGGDALYTNTTGIQNIATGGDALFFNTTGNNNIATGYQSLYSNTIGNSNVANGVFALRENTTGGNNVANGYKSLNVNTTGDNNVANGAFALYINTTGADNVATGTNALYSNTTGADNVATGTNALYSNTTGANNVASGTNALYSNTTGSGNIAFGSLTSAGTYAPVFDATTEDNRLVAGHTSITNAYVQVAWTVVSDERDKTAFAPVPHGLDFVNALKPTEYQFKVGGREGPADGITRYGFLAQDILALEGENPVLVDREDPESLKLKESNLLPIMVNAIQNLSAEVEKLKSQLGEK
jgi:hypothetical protein